MKKYISNSIKLLTTSAALLILCLNSYGQDKKQEISISVGGPFSFVNATLAGGSTVPGNGISAGLRYSYYLNEGLSIGFGVEYQTYNTDIKFKYLAGQYNTVDAEDESFQFRYRATNLREEQKLAYVNVPIGIQFETPGSTKLYVAAGAKIGFATSGSYETRIQNLTTSGYYPQYNVELFSPAFAGFASTDNIKTSKQDIDTDVSYSATFETGLKQNLGDRSSFYIGLYLDYGLNDIYDKSENKNLVQYNAQLPVQLGYNSVFDSSYARDMRLVSYGIKLRFAFR
ncbi:outer membrane beta-barrel protein [Flavobacterium sp. ANB]|uniref:outer membrane beta-barrel protein n=1 Tax=unclassified Flavobacterium TaxID=196869 RepID=UPI0012B90122|nr:MULTISPECIES: outer membrane beta-barrel protein [unclassified Flavobacterium]MBF4516844.1 outer membrane beta-barrel protein [Flavobacterium sp. ANB]MTD69260.1 outer membrane beta-barrel protein [Flavobacterium sp. LC2016-13]